MITKFTSLTLFWYQCEGGHQTAINEAAIKEAAVREATIKEAAITEAAIMEAATAKSVGGGGRTERVANKRNNTRRSKKECGHQVATR